MGSGVGAPRDVTLDELAIELFHPNDRITSDYFHRLARRSS